MIYLNKYLMKLIFFFFFINLMVHYFMRIFNVIYNYNCCILIFINYIFRK